MRYLADRVMVMYLGHVVEIGTTDQVFEPPYHPYTEALLSAVPIADTRVEKEHIVLEGDIPSAVNPPPGCPFQTRCPRKRAGAGRPLRDRWCRRCASSRPGTRSSATCRQTVFDSMQPVIRTADARVSGTSTGRQPRIRSPAPKMRRIQRKQVFAERIFLLSAEQFTEILSNCRVGGRGSVTDFGHGITRRNDIGRRGARRDK